MSVLVIVKDGWTNGDGQTNIRTVGQMNLAITMAPPVKPRRGTICSPDDLEIYHMDLTSLHVNTIALYLASQL